MLRWFPLHEFDIQIAGKKRAGQVITCVPPSPTSLVPESDHSDRCPVEHPLLT